MATEPKQAQHPATPTQQSGELKASADNADMRSTAGEIRTSRAVSPRDIQVSRLIEQFGQLQLQLTEALTARSDPQRITSQTFGEACAAWLEAVKKRPNYANDERLARCLAPLHHFDVDTLSEAEVQAFLLRLLDSRAPQGVNRVKSTGAQILSFAIDRHRWPGPNVFAKTRRLIEPERTYYSLTTDELLRVQAMLRPDRRLEFRVALHTGMRPGELFGLHKCDVDLHAGVIHVRRSHGRGTTKTGRPHGPPPKDDDGAPLHAFHNRGSQPRIEPLVTASHVNLDSCVHAVTCCTPNARDPHLCAVSIAVVAQG